jgi:hypothetical protein
LQKDLIKCREVGAWGSARNLKIVTTQQTDLYVKFKNPEIIVKRAVKYQTKSGKDSESWWFRWDK